MLGTSKNLGAPKLFSRVKVSQGTLNCFFVKCQEKGEYAPSLLPYAEAEEQALRLAADRHNQRMLPYPSLTRGKGSSPPQQVICAIVFIHLWLAYNWI